jgi:hypothetical protein
MTTRTLLLVLHIAGVAAWLGANVLQLVLAPRFAREQPAVAAAFTRQLIWLGERYYNVAGAMIAITGVLLVLDGDWSWSAGFVAVGISVIVIGGVLGVTVFGPQAKRRVAALESGDLADAAAAQGLILRFGLLDTALILTAVLAMVDKWQA